MSTENIYQTRIDVIVQSKYPEILADFKDGFERTTSKFTNLTLHIFDGKTFGAKAINPVLKNVYKNNIYAVGILNDDLWFVDGWLEDATEKLEKYDVVSPGYVETNKMSTFNKAILETENETGVIEPFYGPAGFFKASIFRRIGLFDEQFVWSCDDLDLAWRLKLNGLKSVTSRKITVAHRVGSTRTRSHKSIQEWFKISDKAKDQFYAKHGYQSYRDIRQEYKVNHQYFVNFK